MCINRSMILLPLSLVSVRFATRAAASLTPEVLRRCVDSALFIQSTLGSD